MPALAGTLRVAGGGKVTLEAGENELKGRKAEVEPSLPEGYYLTREGVVKRLGS